MFCGIERRLIRARLHIEGATVFKTLLLVLKGSCRLGLDVPIGCVCVGCDLHVSPRYE